jgi:hypothetical protein
MEKRFYSRTHPVIVGARPLDLVRAGVQLEWTDRARHSGHWFDDTEHEMLCKIPIDFDYHGIKLDSGIILHTYTDPTKTVVVGFRAESGNPWHTVQVERWTPPTPATTVSTVIQVDYYADKPSPLHKRARENGDPCYLRPVKLGTAEVEVSGITVDPRPRGFRGRQHVKVPRVVSPGVSEGTYRAARSGRSAPSGLESVPATKGQQKDRERRSDGPSRAKGPGVKVRRGGTYRDPIAKMND